MPDVLERAAAGAAEGARELQPAMLASPFDLGDEATYARWRAWKLAHRRHDAQALVVPVADPLHLADAECTALVQRIARHGVALYCTADCTADRPAARCADTEVPRAIGAQLGLVRLDANWLSGADGLSRIAVGDAQDEASPGAGGAGPAAPRGEYIPYTDRAIGWHTDGYYHPPERRILGMILHCVRRAAEGGETTLLDPELVYIALRDESPRHIEALEHPRAMSIPAREGEQGVARAAQDGPVFSRIVEPATGRERLHLRYTARTRSIRWRDDAATAAAVARLAALLEEGADALTLRLAPGMGLVGHNVLHKRAAFRDDPAAPRLLLRARYLDRVASAEEDAWRR